ncbi:MAG: Holliday junction branch migration protein RuvA [Rickettsiales bacterium]|jgi:Holliday junction DNA helicase RuvA|nr:Holliday junction branch migration protein RuvA [Rickettsiales bacterium]
MIGKLKGLIDGIFDDYLILDVNGVGYRIFCSVRVLENNKIGDILTLLINTIVREDAILLFGFGDDNEKFWFDVLCNVSGVGSKTALKILGSMSANEMLRAVDSDDAKQFCKVPGIGQASANKILVELKNKRKKLIGSGDGGDMTSITVMTKKNGIVRDALSALENLGYQKNICVNIINEIVNEREDIVLESLITEALKRLNNF